MDNGYDYLKGKVILKVDDADDRRAYGDDPGFIIYFTDGSKYIVSAGMGQGCGYICEEYVE